MISLSIPDEFTFKSGRNKLGVRVCARSPVNGGFGSTLLLYLNGVAGLELDLLFEERDGEATSAFTLGFCERDDAERNYNYIRVSVCVALILRFEPSVVGFLEEDCRATFFKIYYLSAFFLSSSRY